VLDGDKVKDETVSIRDNVFGYDDSLVVYFLFASCLEDILRKERNMILSKRSPY